MATIPSLKHALIEKSNTTVVVVTAVATFIVVFSAVAVWSLLGQFTYQNQVIGADQAALKQIQIDSNSVQTLQTSYNTFVNTATNSIGGSSTGNGPQDGTNAKVILDALPSKYDYPALVTSLETILSGQSVQIDSIGGTDAAATAGDQSSAQPAPQPMPFQIVVTGNYAAIQKVITTFQRSIRPFQILTMDISGDQSKLTLSLSAQTYWQPAKNLAIRTEALQ